MTENTNDKPVKNNPGETQHNGDIQPPQTIPYKKEADSENTAITENTDGRKSKNPDMKNPADEQQFEQDNETKNLE